MTKNTSNLNALKRKSKSRSVNNVVGDDKSSMLKNDEFGELGMCL